MIETRERGQAHWRVDTFLDVDDARNAIDNELNKRFNNHPKIGDLGHVARLWWDAPSPQLYGLRPIELWNANPDEFPLAKDAVYSTVMNPVLPEGIGVRSAQLDDEGTLFRLEIISRFA